MTHAQEGMSEMVSGFRGEFERNKGKIGGQCSNIL